MSLTDWLLRRLGEDNYREQMRAPSGGATVQDALTEWIFLSGDGMYEDALLSRFPSK